MLLNYVLPTNDHPIVGGITPNTPMPAINLPASQNITHYATLAALIATDDLDRIASLYLHHNDTNLNTLPTEPQGPATQSS
jgi:hypothetical protein